VQKDPDAKTGSKGFRGDPDGGHANLSHGDNVGNKEKNLGEGCLKRLCLCVEGGCGVGVGGGVWGLQKYRKKLRPEGGKQ